MKYKIVRHKGLGNWFLYKRYLFFFWYQVNTFMGFSQALMYVENHNCDNCEVIDEQNGTRFAL